MLKFLVDQLGHTMSNNYKAEARPRRQQAASFGLSKGRIYPFKKPREIWESTPGIQRYSLAVFCSACSQTKQQKAHVLCQKGAPFAVCGILGSGEQTRIESCIIRIPESMVESQQCSPN
jgi:hypothetical protein